MVTTAPSVVREAEQVIEKDREWFLREYKDAKSMPNEAKKIAKNLHQAALSKSDIRMFRLLVVQLSQVERDQRMEQFNIGFNKLKKIMVKLLQLPVFNQPSRKRQKEELINLTREEQVWKAGELTDTADKLDPLVRDKELHQITGKNWNRIIELTGGLLTKLRASVLVTRRMEKIIEKVTGIRI